MSNNSRPTDDDRQPLFSLISLMQLIMAIMALVILAFCYFGVDFTSPNPNTFAYSLKGFTLSLIIALIPADLIFIFGVILFQRFYRAKASQESENIAGRVARLMRSEAPLINTRLAGVKEVSSEEWFKIIDSQLRDASKATIYLRHFDHPDHFKAEHKDNLLKIMNTFSRKMVESRNSWKIVAYREDRSKKDPRKWLLDEISAQVDSVEADAIVKDCVRILDSQSYSNNSTIYIIDGNEIIYNYRGEDSKMRYFQMKMPGSAIPQLIQDGIISQFETGRVTG
jgi:heme/copper-type cytochrome/quinol oxidase subunit 2